VETPLLALKCTVDSNVILLDAQSARWRIILLSISSLAQILEVFDLRATLLLELHEWLIAELTCLQSWFDDPEGHEPGLNSHETFAPSAHAQLSLV